MEFIPLSFLSSLLHQTLNNTRKRRCTSLASRKYGVGICYDGIEFFFSEGTRKYIRPSSLERTNGKGSPSLEPLINYWGPNVGHTTTGKSMYTCSLHSAEWVGWCRSPCSCDAD